MKLFGLSKKQWYILFPFIVLAFLFEYFLLPIILKSPREPFLYVLIKDVLLWLFFLTFFAYAYKKETKKKSN